jgi:outer membrane biosynthesis protein TonB
MRILVLSLFIFSFTFTQAQKIEVREVKVSDPQNVLVQEADTFRDLEFENTAIPFAVVEQVPLFGSCEKIEKNLQRECFQEEIKKHIEKHLKYPEEAKENKIEARVFVTFEIEKDGKISVERVKSNLRNEYGILFEAEAKRIINLLPNFIPATQRGKIVKVIYAIPINFKL